MVGLLRALGLFGVADPDRRIEQCLALQTAACSLGEAWTHGIAELSDLQVSMDLDRRDRKRSAEAAERLDTKAKAVRVFSKPAECRHMIPTFKAHILPEARSASESSCVYLPIPKLQV